MYIDFMEKAVSCRSSNGQFLPGFSGNPGGRPKDEFKVAELARSYTVEAVETLVDLMRYSKDDRVRGTASQALLDRGWGKALRWKWLPVADKAISRRYRRRLR